MAKQFIYTYSLLRGIFPPPSGPDSKIIFNEDSSEMELLGAQERGIKKLIPEPLDGSHYVFVVAKGTPIENAAELRGAYVKAQGMAPSSTNKITIIAAPGNYNFETNIFEMDTEFIDLVSLDGNRSVIFNATLDDTTFVARTGGSINITANNVFVKGVDVQTKNFTIGDDLPFLKVENCKGGNFSFGGVEFEDPELIISGTFVDCEGGDFSFGGNGEAVGLFKGCIGGDESFGYTSVVGTFIDCEGGILSFGAYGLIDGAVFENCKSETVSFGSGGVIFDSSVKNSKGGDFCFGSSAVGVVNSEFENCIGGLDSFGGNIEVLNTGRYYRCRLTDGTFYTPDLDGFVVLGIDGNNEVQNIIGGLVE